MNQYNQILKSKLLAPHLSDIIRRERLYTKLDEIPQKKLTTVVAGAGFGKTTLIAETCNRIGLNSVWYRIDETDRDFITFLNYISTGIRNHFPEFKGETVNLSRETNITSHSIKEILFSFIYEIENIIEKDFLIILDDYHLIQNSKEIKEALEFILEHLPGLLHLVVISRSEPDLRVSKFRARRELLNIHERDLAFTISETKQLYSQLFDIFLQDTSLKTLQKKTDGWVSGLILFYHSLRGKSQEEIEKPLLKLKGSHKIISDYLEENVFELLPGDIKEFLIKTSILSRINPDFCDQFLDIQNSNNILTQLDEKHLFTFPFDETRELYYYHHLFQEFLQTKLNQKYLREEIKELHNKAAELYEQIDEQEDALRLYLSAENYEKVCELIIDLRDVFLNSGRLNLIASYIKEIPEQFISKQPRIKVIQAWAMQLSGNRKKAIQITKEVFKSFHKQKGEEGSEMILLFLGINYYRTGKFIKAEKNLTGLLNQDKGEHEFSISVLSQLIFINSHMGKMEIADKYFNRAIPLLKEVEENNDTVILLHVNQGYRYVHSGDFKKALDMGEEILKMCENNDKYYLSLMVCHLISWSCYYLGYHQKGMEIAQKGIRTAKEKGFFEDFYAWLIVDSVLNGTELGQFEKSIEDGKKSAQLFEELGCQWGQAYALHALCNTYLKLADLTAAEECARTGMELIKGLKLTMDKGFHELGLAEILIEKDQPQDAAPLLASAEKKLKSSKWLLFRTYLIFARFYYVQNKNSPALRKLMSGLEVSRSNQYDIWVVSEKEWIIPLLVEAMAQGKMTPYLEIIFKKIGLEARKELLLLQKTKNSRIRKAASFILVDVLKEPPPGLTVYCFGEFKLFKGDVEIPAEQWKSKKAKMIFKYLLYTRPRGYLSREVLMELLWPEEDPQKSVNRLHDALSSLRKILEPEIQRGILSSYLIRDGESYRLNLGDNSFVDMDEFRNELSLAKNVDNPISHLLNAETFYKGDFLEEDLHVEWCIEERVRLKEAYLNLLENIINHFEGEKNFKKCIEYAGKYLKADKYAENIYQQLMVYYSMTGNKSMVTKTFERCEENIGKGLDTPLSQDTQLLYQKLTSQKSN